MPTTFRLKRLQTIWLAAVAILGWALICPLGAVSWRTGSSPLRIVDVLADDAYYYLTIASNMAETGLSTVDGITLTNGYHPFWLLILSGLAAVVGTSPWSLFRATCWLVAVIAAASVCVPLLWRKGAARQTAWLAATGLAVAMVQHPATFLEGMEPILFAPLFVPLVLLLESGRSRRNLLMLSAVLAACFLARIDALVIFGVVAAWVGMGEWRAKRSSAKRSSATPGIGILPALALLSAVVLPVAVLYLVVNQVIFHTPVPVSGIAKSLAGPKLANWGVLSEYVQSDYVNDPMALVLLVGILGVLEIAAWRCGRWTPVLLRSLAVFGVSALLQALYYAAFSSWYVWPWYTYLKALTVALLIGRIVHLSLQLIDQRRLRVLGLVALAVPLISEAWLAEQYTIRSLHLLVHRAMGREEAAPLYRDLSYNQISILMLDTFLAGKPRVQAAMGDRAGGLAYWGRRALAIVQVEGLTLDMAYITARRQASAEEYFASHFDLKYWIVDREAIPLIVREDGARELVVVDPIQGRTTLDPLPTFCFPENAVLYQQDYGLDQWRSKRVVFSFADRQACSARSRAFIADTIGGIGIRQVSLPGEYDRARDGWRDKQSEDRDRGYARTLRKW